MAIEHNFNTDDLNITYVGGLENGDSERIGVFEDGGKYYWYLMGRDYDTAQEIPHALYLSLLGFGDGGEVFYRGD